MKTEERVGKATNWKGDIDLTRCRDYSWPQAEHSLSGGGKGGISMKYTRFEELPVWQVGMEVTESVFRMTGDRAFCSQGDLANQLQRAALSVCNNIAEGFERGTTSELLTFLYYARGSAGEVRSMLILCDRMERFGHLKSQISNLKSEIAAA